MAVDVEERHGSWISIERISQEQGLPPFRTHPDGWNVEGYAILDLDVHVPAIMDGDGRISDSHHVRVLIPRGYPEDAIKWGLFFESEPPFHPNILKMDDDGLSILAGIDYASGATPSIDGTVCIGMAGNDARPVELLTMLRRMLSMEDERDFVLVQDGGNQDTPWDEQVLSVCAAKYAVFRSALAEHTTHEKKQITPKPRTGKSLRRKTSNAPTRSDARPGLRRRTQS